MLTTPRGGFGHAGLDSDLPGPQKPPETSKTKEKRTQTKSQNFFFLVPYLPIEALEIGFQTFPAGYMEDFARRIRIRTPKSPNPTTRTDKTSKKIQKQIRKSLF